jgi:DNA-binding MarR family transcriptional regulator
MLARVTVEADSRGWLLGVRLLLASRALFDELHRRLAVAGHDGLRPAHGFLFQAVGAQGATASEIAASVGMTKQAARLVVDELAELGYVERSRDAQDARRRPVVLTARGRDALRRSEAIFTELREELAADLGAHALAQGMRLLEAIDDRYGPAPLRPVW